MFSNSSGFNLKLGSHSSLLLVYYMYKININSNISSHVLATECQIIFKSLDKVVSRALPTLSVINIL